MKTSLLAILVLSPAAALFAQQPAAPLPLIATSGTAQIRVVPDLADLYYEVEIRHADLATARKEEAERAGKILAALRAGGVAEAELQSSQVQISANYTSEREQTEKVRFFQVTQSFTCTVHDLKKIPELTSEAVKAGATEVREASLRTSQLRKYRDEARAAAIHAAKEKAVALAGELGVRVGRPQGITEGAESYLRTNTYNGNNVQVAVAAEGEGGEGMSAFAPGTISVTASVGVSFVLE